MAASRPSTAYPYTLIPLYPQLSRRYWWICRSGDLALAEEASFQ